jgi:hypothetical protein
MNPRKRLSSAGLSTNPASSIRFAIGLVTVSIASVLLAGWFPIQLSIVTVFLFAGPHNWVEARYFLTRLPARWGKLRVYFLTAMFGIWGLAVAFVALPIVTSIMGWSITGWKIGLSLWNSALIVWIVSLLLIRSHQPPRRDWSTAVPIGLVLMSFAWLDPALFNLSLVYLHPLVGFWILDLEITRSQPEWSRAYRYSLLLLPLLLLLLLWQLQNSPTLVLDGPLVNRILRHSGADLLPWISNRLLVATHVFLELLHYGIWLLAIPLVSRKLWMGVDTGMPLARNSLAWRKFIGVAILASSLAVVLLWIAFLLDYSTARDIYFTVAIVHVLAEVPFLLRAI